MSTQSLAGERADTRRWAVPWVLISYIVIGLSALLPRVLDLGRWLSGDESSFWLRRSDIFLTAIRTGDFAATAVTTHPGVTTMWLGSAGLMLRDVLVDTGVLTNVPFPTFLTIMRLPMELVHVAGILVGYALLRRMFTPVMAALAALLWALDPFVIAFSRVLHVDALPATFATISLLAACLFWHHERHTRWLVLSGIAGGLAVLSKSPSLALMPVIGLMALLDATKREEGSTEVSWKARLWPQIRWLALWGILCAATVFVLWPALWVGPMRAYVQVRAGIEAEGASPHMLGNFFLGKEDDSPGPLFYPVALALRLTPWALLGILALPFVWRAAKRSERRDLAALACFAIVFLVAMSVFPKKFNRYLVPMFPAVDILAAFGLVGSLNWFASLFQRNPKAQDKYRQAGFATAGMVAIALAAALNAAYWHPYGIAAFNQLLGGAAAGPRTFVIGWGEGLSDAADWLNQQPDIKDVRVATTMTTGLQEFLRSGAQSVVPTTSQLPPATGYVLVYARNVQWDAPKPPFDEFYGRETPAHVVTIHGIDYVWIYRAPPSIDTSVPADFGPDIHLRGYSEVAPPVPGQPLLVHLVWKARAQPTADVMLFAHLIGADGQTASRVDLPYNVSAWPADQYQQTELAVPLPADLPAGTYRLVIGLYDPSNGQRLQVQAQQPIDPALDGPDALILGEFEIR